MEDKNKQIIPFLLRPNKHDPDMIEVWQQNYFCCLIHTDLIANALPDKDTNDLFKDSPINVKFCRLQNV